MDGELRSIFRDHLPMVAWSTIETGGVEPGVADSNGLYDGVEFWVEMKKTLAWALDVKASQVAWHKLRQSKLGRTFFAVRRMHGKTDDLYVIHGKYAERLRTSGLEGCPCLLLCAGGPARWRWPAVLETLITRHP
jgi:hypothetical protein